MGYIYAHTSLLSIVGSYEGLTKEEILDLNMKTFKAKIEQHWDRLIPLNDPPIFGLEIVERDGRYFLSEELKKHNKANIPSWREGIEEMLNCSA